MTVLPKYAASLQKALDAFSSEYIPLSVRTGMMDSKTQFTATLLEFEKHTPPKTRKDAKLNEVLTMYHSAVTTKQRSAELFELLNKTHEECDRTLLSDYDLDTIGGSGYDAEDIKKNQLARRTVVRLLADVIDKVKIQLLDTIQVRLPLTEDELEKLVTYLTGAAKASTLWQLGQKYNMFSRTPNLEKSYGEWLAIHQDEALMAIDPSKQKLIAPPSLSSSEEDASFKLLDEALKVLNMTYVDPETNVTYGVAKATRTLVFVPMEMNRTSMEPVTDRLADLDSKEATEAVHSAIHVSREESESVQPSSTPDSTTAAKPQPPKGPPPSKKPAVQENATSDPVVEPNTGTDDVSAAALPSRPTRGPISSKHHVVLTSSSGSKKGASGDQKKTE